ncbi:MAG: acetoin utilization protein AcuC [Deltaproteobacteria bacterium]|nr:acetoin utilization protein AcuC [Deltaproteobacteria bacterium]
MKTAFLYSDEFGKYSYGSSHPMRPIRLKLAYELIKAYGLLNLPNTQLIEARKATEEELLLFHTKDYIKTLKQADSGDMPKDGWKYGLGFGDNPVFQGMYEWSLYSAGASVQAAELISSVKADIAFNICGGLHHAMADKASGFCYLNDAAVAIKYLLTLGKRIAYIDIDAHHGDGVQAAFYDTDKVLTISLHESGHHLFPGTGFFSEIGVGNGRGYSVNLPFPPETDDEVFVKGFEKIVPLFIDRFKPDIIVTQLGVDTFRTDPITHLTLTTNGFERMIKGFKALKLPWLALGGGGYNLSNVARAWTLAWAVMNDKIINEEMPPPYRESVVEFGLKETSLRDKPFTITGSEKGHMIREVESTIERLKKDVLPLVGQWGKTFLSPQKKIDTKENSA